jgi:myo-inositol-1(or 4)-monophosphatase
MTAHHVWQAELDFAVETVERSGRIALDYFRTPMRVDDKSTGGSFDPVTQADTEIEAFLRGEILERFPDHGIIGEESGAHAPSAHCRWVIDPIDGTRAFMSGMPAWGTLLALMVGGRVALGVMHQPYLRETFYGDGKTAGLRRPGERSELRTRVVERVEDAVLYSTHPDLFRLPEERRAFDRLASHVRLTRYGGDCYSYCLLAMGQIDLVVEAGLQAHDIAALIPIIEGAGGIVTTWAGTDAQAGGRILAAGDARLHAHALAILADAPAWR